MARKAKFKLGWPAAIGGLTALGLGLWALTLRASPAGPEPLTEVLERGRRYGIRVDLDLRGGLGAGGETGVDARNALASAGFVSVSPPSDTPPPGSPPGVDAGATERTRYFDAVWPSPDRAVDLPPSVRRVWQL